MKELCYGFRQLLSGNFNFIGMLLKLTALLITGWSGHTTNKTQAMCNVGQSQQFPGWYKPAGLDPGTVKVEPGVLESVTFQLF